MKCTRRWWSAAVAMVVAVASLVATSVPSGAGSTTREVHVGALLSLTGDGETLGTTTKAALEIAAKRWNATPGQGVKVLLDIENTNLEPDKALAGLTRLADKDVPIVIGPQSSSEVAAIADTAAARGVLVVSQGSTASSLAQPDDNVFRFVPTDRVEGRASVDLMKKNGATTIVPMWRNDRGNTGLSESVRAAATASGMTVTDGVVYEPGTTDFGPALADLSSQVQSAVATAGAGKVAVYAAGFEEVAEVFNAAQSVSGLDSVRWYGGDGSAQAKSLVARGPATFATSSGVKGYPSPLVALPADRVKRDAKLLAEISKRAGNRADAFTMEAYDAFNVAVRTLANTDPDTLTDPAVLRSAFVATANGAKGVTGTVELDAAGDRVSAPYTFWSICAGRRGNARWVDTGRWTPAADPTGPGKVEAKSCPKR